MNLNPRFALLAVLSCTMLFVTGCNEPEKFDINALFSVEDYAADRDYALEAINIIQKLQEITELQTGLLGGSEEAVPFDEVLPSGWQYPNDQGEMAGWYKKNSQINPIWVRFDHLIEVVEEPHQRKVEYLSDGFLEETSGDSVAIWYTDNYENFAKAEGISQHLSIKILFSGSSTGGELEMALMKNEYDVTVSEISTIPGNKSIIIDMSGSTLIASLTDEATLNTSMELSIRANGSGETSFYVEDIERVRIKLNPEGSLATGHYWLADEDWEIEHNF